MGFYCGIEKIKCVCPETPTNNWVRILDEKLNEDTWLCYQKKVGWGIDANVKKLNVSIAYAYDGKQLVAVPNGGQVFTYFPCINEKSNLSFHINAPFATTPTRDTISQKEEHIGYNKALMDAIAELVCESLLDIKKRGLLTLDFLTLLPAGKQNGIYSPIRERILREFRNHELYPTRDGTYIKKEDFFDIEDNDLDTDNLNSEAFPLKADDKPLFPTSNSVNPTRREEKTKAQYEVATDKAYETKLRSVRTSANAISPSSLLKTLYTNEYGQMVCQLCGYEMPFKKRDGEYYFEAVEVLTKDFLPKEFESQHLALCPECAARYVEYVKKDDGKKMEQLKIELLKEGNEPVVLLLGDKEFELQFVEKHRIDLKVALRG